MIPDAKFFYGSVISSLVDGSAKAISIHKLANAGAGFYLINGTTPLFIKYSTSRKGPWLFNFRQEHQSAQQTLFDSYGECLVALVCGHDGIAALSWQNLRQVLDHNFGLQESIRIVRGHKEMYGISGTDGVLGNKVSRSSLLDFFNKLDSQLIPPQ